MTDEVRQTAEETEETSQNGERESEQQLESLDHEKLLERFESARVFYERWYLEDICNPTDPIAREFIDGPQTWFDLVRAANDRYEDVDLDIRDIEDAMSYASAVINRNSEHIDNMPSRVPVLAHALSIQTAAHLRDYVHANARSNGGGFNEGDVARFDESFNELIADARALILEFSEDDLYDTTVLEFVDDYVTHTKFFLNALVKRVAGEDLPFDNPEIVHLDRRSQVNYIVMASIFDILSSRRLGLGLRTIEISSVENDDHAEASISGGIPTGQILLKEGWLCDQIPTVMAHRRRVYNPATGSMVPVSGFPPFMCGVNYLDRNRTESTVRKISTLEGCYEKRSLERPKVPVKKLFNDYLNGTRTEQDLLGLVPMGNAALWLAIRARREVGDDYIRKVELEFEEKTKRQTKNDEKKARGEPIPHKERVWFGKYLTAYKEGGLLDLFERHVEEWITSAKEGFRFKDDEESYIPSVIEVILDEFQRGADRDGDDQAWPGETKEERIEAIAEHLHYSILAMFVQVTERDRDGKAIDYELRNETEVLKIVARKMVTAIPRRDVLILLKRAVDEEPDLTAMTDEARERFLVGGSGVSQESGCDYVARILRKIDATRSIKDKSTIIQDNIEGLRGVLADLVHVRQLGIRTSGDSMNQARMIVSNRKRGGRIKNDYARLKEELSAIGIN